MKVKITDLTPTEIVTIVEDLLKRGKFSEGVITNAVEKEALSSMLNTYKQCVEDMNFQNAIDKFLDKVDKSIGG